MFVCENDNESAVLGKRGMTGLKRVRHAVFICLSRRVFISVVPRGVINQFAIFRLVIPFRGERFSKSSVNFCTQAL